MDGDWRERYLKLVEEGERASRERVETERELTRLITRVCVALSGVDPDLDPQLHRLRGLAKSGETASLVKQADAIGNALIRTADGRSDAGVLPLLLRRARLGERAVKDAMALWTRIAAAPAEATDDELDQLAELLRPEGADPVDRGGPGAGFFSRWMGRPGPDQDVNRRLLEVLGSVPWPEVLHGDVAVFTETLEQDERGDAWVGVVRQITDLVIDALGAAQDSTRSAEAFLTALNRHLEELDQHMLEERERREQSRASGERLGHEMRSEVGNLSASVRDSVDLAQLQSSVLSSLDRMHQHVRHHLEDENARRAKAEAEANRLRAELRVVEEQTFDLRRQIASTQQAALKDPLTGLPNRRAYDERIEQEFARWKRFGDPLALIVFDVDDFKKINDAFGHKAGDRTLTMIGKLLRARLRETDFIARFGGEELVVLLIGAGLDDAVRLADAMRQSVEDGGLHAHGQPVRVTVSGGLSLFRSGDSPGDAFDRADRAMYQAKQRGKNQVVVG